MNFQGKRFLISWTIKFQENFEWMKPKWNWKTDDQKILFIMKIICITFHLFTHWVCIQIIIVATTIKWLNYHQQSLVIHFMLKNILRDNTSVILLIIIFLEQVSSQQPNMDWLSWDHYSQFINIIIWLLTGSNETKQFLSTNDVMVSLLFPFLVNGNHDINLVIDYA